MRNAPQRQRSPTVPHSCPADDHAPVSTPTVSQTPSAYGCARYPLAAGGSGSKLSRVRPTGSNSRVRT